MNRVIKFRGKDVDTGKWVYGSYFEHEKVNLFYFDTDLQNEKLKNKIKNNKQYWIIQDGFADFNMNNPVHCIDVIPETVGQYTGLKDKNGVEIYEGDIVKNILILEHNTFSTNEDIVVYNQEDCSFMLGKGKRHFNKNLDLEVIGNIYDKGDK